MLTGERTTIFARNVVLPAHPAGVTELYVAYVEQLRSHLLQPADITTSAVDDGRMLMEELDAKRKATRGQWAIGFESLAAEANGIFAGVLGTLRLPLREIAEHSAAFGVRVRGVVTQR